MNDPKPEHHREREQEAGEAEGADKQFVEACIQGESFAWEKFVDQYLPLIAGVVDFVADEQGEQLSETQRSDIVTEVFQWIAAEQFDFLKRYDGSSNLDTYLTVAAQRVAASRLATWNSPSA